MKLVFATNNPNKAREINQLLPEGFTVKTLKDIGFSGDIPETETTIEGNALLKARFVYNRYGINCFADDSGLEVDALNGAPGVYSARYAGETCNDNENIKKLLLELNNKANRNANFKTVIALIINGKEYVFTGIIKGEITEIAIGEKGFGYDPVFKPSAFDVTFAQMDMAEKNKISHRAQAIAQMVEYLNSVGVEERMKS